METTIKSSIGAEPIPPIFLNQTGKTYWTKGNLQARIDLIYPTHVVVKMQGQYHYYQHNGRPLGNTSSSKQDIIPDEVRPEDIRLWKGDEFEDPSITN